MSNHVPIHGRPMTGMNPFDNNRPNLTSSERIRNKRDKTIYQAEKQRFQAHKSCGNRNVRYYENGRIRNMQSYKIQQSLARGSVLCEDCDDKGLLCGDVAKSNFAKFNMGNNDVSEFWGGGGLGGVVSTSGHAHTFDTFQQTPGFPVIDVDISGVWDPSGLINGAGMPKHDISMCGPSGDIVSPWGYADNIINIPRNLDGLGIVIDPSNLLYSDSPCLNSHFNAFSQVKTWLVVTGAVPIHFGVGGIFSGLINSPSNCNDPSYNSLPGQHIRGKILLGDNIFSGQIKNLCCKREQQMTWDPGDGVMITRNVGIFDVYIELFKISQYSTLSTLVNLTPTYNSITGLWTWNLDFFIDLAFTLVDFKDAHIHHIGVWFMHFIESMKMIQGTIPPYLNQTIGNNTKQDYLSCLDDGTKKINFTKNTTKKENIITTYCEKFIKGSTTLPP